MARKVDEWIATHDDQKIPDRVKVRVFDRYGGRCYLTGVQLRPGHWECEHVKALINGGEHRESNLAPVAKVAHKAKSAADMAEKSKVYQVRKKHIGVKTRKGPPMPGSKASPYKRKINGTIERRD